MKRFIALALAAVAFGSAQAQPNVSISVHQPGVYGRIDIGRFPQPALVYAEPVLVAPPRVAVQRQPIYLYVPPAHQRDWRRYCGRYSACGQPVYFVQETWVRDEYRREHDNRNGRKFKNKDQHDDRGNNGRGRGNGKND